MRWRRLWEPIIHRMLGQTSSHLTVSMIYVINFRGLGRGFILDCGVCDGPSNLRLADCKECAEKRSKITETIVRRRLVT
jgi:hypothetical protein